MAIPLILHKEYNQCLICKANLGHETKLAELPFCHEHVKCSICNQAITAHEARWLLQQFMEEEKAENTANVPELDYTTLKIYHVKCSPIPDKMTTIKQSDYDYLNILRLTFEPNTSLSTDTNEKEAGIWAPHLVENMNFEQKCLLQARMMAAIEAIGRAKLQDKDYRRNYLDERERERFKKAKETTAISPKPNHGIVTPKESKEAQLAHFIELHFNSNPGHDIAKKILGEMNKSIDGLVKVGVPEPTAREQVLNILKQQKRIEK